MARYGDINIFVTDENPRFDNYSTDQPIEDGAEITDHVINEPVVLNITGQIAADDAGDRFNQLRKMRRERQPHLYVGRNYISRCIINRLETEHDRFIRNGFRFRMELKQIQISKPSPIKELQKDIENNVEEVTQAKNVENKGRQSVAEKEPTERDMPVGTPQFERFEPEETPVGTPQMERFEEEDIAVGDAVPR